MEPRRDEAPPFADEGSGRECCPVFAQSAWRRAAGALRRTRPSCERRGVRRVAQDRTCRQAQKRLHQPLRHMARTRHPRMGAHRPQPSLRHHVLYRQRDMRGIPEDSPILRVRHHRPFARPDGGGGRPDAASDECQQQPRKLHERLPDRPCADGVQLFFVAVPCARCEISRRAVFRHGVRVHEFNSRRVPLPRGAEVGRRARRELPQLVLLLGGGGVEPHRRRLGVCPRRAMALDGQGGYVHGRVRLDWNRLSWRTVLVRQLAQEAAL